MEEARRFLRYVTPGLVFLLEFALFLWLGWLGLSGLDREAWTKSLRKLFPQNDGGLDKIVIAAATAFVASGGIGFLLSTFHHFLVGTLYHYIGLGFRYRRILNLLESRNLLRIVDLSDVPLHIRWWQAGREWTVVTGLWHERRELQRIKGATPRADSLADSAHSLGATFLGSLFALGLALFFLGSLDQKPLFWIVSLLLVALHLMSYIRVVRVTRNYIGLILLQEFRGQQLPQQPPPPAGQPPGEQPQPAAPGQPLAGPMPPAQQPEPWVVHFPSGTPSVDQHGRQDQAPPDQVVPSTSWDRLVSRILACLSKLCRDQQTAKKAAAKGKKHDPIPADDQTSGVN
jgi:hypothetical protein